MCLAYLAREKGRLWKDEDRGHESILDTKEVQCLVPTTGHIQDLSVSNQVSTSLDQCIADTVYHALCPPSIRRSLPVIKLLASLMRNTAAPLNSCGLLSLPNMFCVGQSRFRSGYCSNKASTIAVTMYPGERVLTRIPWTPHSDARLRASCMTPALEAL
jgi:hypothetical protein